MDKDDSSHQSTLIGAYNKYLLKQQQHHQQTSQNLENKKIYLSQHIINYYAQQEEKIHRFAELLKNHIQESKGIAVEERILDHLTLEQLKEFISNYRGRFPNSQIKQSIIQLCQDDLSNQEEDDSQEGQYSDSDKFSAEKVTYKNGAWDYFLSGYEECKRTKPIFEINKQAQEHVTFGKAEVRKSGGFFGLGGKLQLWMQIRNKMTDDTVWRKAQDFIFIKNMLHNLFPFRYIPLLQITQKQLQSLHETSKSQSIINKCLHFINQVCKQSYLTQNKYVFRFFKQKKYENYLQHKSTAIQKPVTKINEVQNSQGFVEIEISSDMQEIKMDYLKKGVVLQRFWNNLSSFNARMVNSFKAIEKELVNQQKQFQKVRHQFTTVNSLITSSPSYSEFATSLTMYNDVFNSCVIQVNQFKQFFNEVNLRVSENYQVYWRGFNEYSKNIAEINQVYYTKRKGFQQKWSNQPKPQPHLQQQKQVQTKGNIKIDPVNMSILKEMGLHENEAKQMTWIQRYSKWQGYLNTQFKFSFNRLFQDNLTLFSCILKNYSKLNKVARLEL